MTQPDLITRFLLPHIGIRGVHVRLQSSWLELLSHAHYGPHTTALLGQSCAAASLFTANTKLHGRLSIQLHAPHSTSLRSLFAECTAAGTMRGIARIAANQDSPTDLRLLGTETKLGITIETPGLNPEEPQRYQSLIALDTSRMDEALELYFDRSEQLPTRLLLAASSDAAAGMMLQRLPGENTVDEDDWQHAVTLFDTLKYTELLALDGPTLLHRLYHQEQPNVLSQKEIVFGCSCSRERVLAMFEALGETEAYAAVEESGHVEVNCEFCGRHYDFPSEDILALFRNPRSVGDPPQTVQ